MLSFSTALSYGLFNVRSASLTPTSDPRFASPPYKVYWPVRPRLPYLAVFGISHWLSTRSMADTLFLGATAAVAIATLWYILQAYLTSSPLDNLPGPPSPSFLLGALSTFLRGGILLYCLS